MFCRNNILHVRRHKRALNVAERHNLSRLIWVRTVGEGLENGEITTAAAEKGKKFREC